MSKTSNGINKVRHPAIRNTAGTGYVVLSRQVPKDEYIANCFRNSTVTIITDTNEVITNVMVSKDIWQYIEFPAEMSERGSCIAWLNIHGKNKPIAIAIINKKDQFNEIQTTNSFKYSRTGDNTAVLIEGLGDKGHHNIIVSGDDEGTGQIKLRVLNKNNKGLFDLMVQGDIDIEGDNDANIKLKHGLYLKIIDENDKTKQSIISYELGKGFTLKDEFNNEVTTSKDGIVIKDDFKNSATTSSDGIVLQVDTGKKITNKGGPNIEPALLGDKTQEAIDAINDALQTIAQCLTTVAAANMTGPTAPVGASMTTGAANSMAKVVICKTKAQLIKSKTVEVS